MIRINEIKLPLESNNEDVLAAAAKALRCPKRKIASMQIVKKSLDSRKKENSRKRWYIWLQRKHNRIQCRD